MDTHPAAWQPLGTHLLRVVDDLMFMQVRGALELSDMQALVQIGAQQISRYGYFLSVVDGTLGTTMTPAARRYNAQWMRENQDALGSSMVYGASRIARAIITMIDRATTLLSMRPSTSHFVANEAEALEFAARERQRLRAEVAQRRLAR